MFSISRASGACISAPRAAGSCSLNSSVLLDRWRMRSRDCGGETSWKSTASNARAASIASRPELRCGESSRRRTPLQTWSGPADTSSYGQLTLDHRLELAGALRHALGRCGAESFRIKAPGHSTERDTRRSRSGRVHWRVTGQQGLRALDVTEGTHRLRAAWVRLALRKGVAAHHRDHAMEKT